jgi:hypothetical protein
MFGRTVLAATLALALGATAAQAQIGGGYPGGRGGGFPGGRGGRGGMGARRMATRAVIPDLRNPIRLIVDNKDDLKLSAAQLQRVDSIKGALDRQNDTLIAQIKRGLGEDSAMARGGPGGGDRRDGGEADNPTEAADRRAARAEVLRDHLKVLQPTFEQIKQNDDEAWKAATTALEKDQRKKADRIRKDDQKAYDQSHSPFGEGWPGRRGGENDND